MSLFFSQNLFQVNQDYRIRRVLAALHGSCINQRTNWTRWRATQLAAGCWPCRAGHNSVAMDDWMMSPRLFTSIPLHCCGRDIATELTGLASRLPVLPALLCPALPCFARPIRASDPPVRSGQGGTHLQVLRDTPVVNGISSITEPSYFRRRTDKTVKIMHKAKTPVENTTRF